MKDQTCCFTGRRAIPAEEVPMFKERLEQIIDTLAAQAVLKRKRDFPQLRLVLA